MSQNDERVVCKVCGKSLTRKQSVTAEIGHRCDTLLAQGWNAEKLTANYAKISGPVPEGFVKLADLDRKIKLERNGTKFPGITISKMVRAIGKDRGVEPPLHPIAQPIYDSRRHRWVNGWLMTKDGLTAIATGDFSKAPAK